MAIKIFCRRIIVNKPEMLKEKGPLLLACNHPNSFLDGVILDTLFKSPLYSLARGDAFKRPLYRKLLGSLNLLPVYRTSEGVENLSSNYDTFKECIDLFRKNAIIIIFSEGKCINEWHLRPLKKGTARLAFASWENDVPLRVLPVGINYSSFTRFGKNLFIQFGEMIEIQDVDMNQPDGIRHQAFNNQLEQQLKKLVFEIPKNDKNRQQHLLEIRPSTAQKIFYFLPACIGWLLHWPLYTPVRNFTHNKTIENDHYDSILTGILLFAYPVYLLIIAMVLFVIIGSWLSFLVFVALPFTAYAYVQLKPQLDR